MTQMDYTDGLIQMDYTDGYTDGLYRWITQIDYTDNTDELNWW